ncbi:MAG TPA: DUF4407 domain-containing protein, partial [Streptomyces sp.]|uniref:DUF4407 domain-containing protein n=1 Tax=Streptomyces sp. TaxID=1931 RepID=UPI002C8B8CFD
MTARLRRIGDGLAGLAGAHPDLLEAVPTARARYVALGGVLLSTGGLAVLSASFAVHMALGAPWPVAVVFGLGWGVVIINLDRMLLVGMAYDSSIRRNLLLAMPRVALALVLGTVIATPLTLQVFHPEIDTEVVTLRAEAADAHKTSLDSDARFRPLPTLRARVAAEQAVIASGGRTDPALAAVHEQVRIEQAAYEEAVRSHQELSSRAQCELDGTCGTGDAGDGTAYQGAKAAADAQAAVVSAAKTRFDGAVRAAEDGEARSSSQAQADLATDQATLTGLTAQQDRLQAAFEATNKDDDGILIRLQALNRLSERNSTLGLAHLMLSLLFICIELLPVLMKVLSNFGPPSTYDQLMGLRDGGNLEVEQVQQQTRREMEVAQAELRVMAERERVEREKQVILARHEAAQAQKAVQAREAAEAQEAAEALEAAMAREASEARKVARAKRAAEARAAAEAQRAAEAQAAAEALAVAEARRAARAR